MKKKKKEESDVSAPPHLLGGLVAQLSRDASERLPVDSSLLTGGQDGSVRLSETKNINSKNRF